MELERLKDRLRSWVQTDTWHTGHANDMERFHKALSNVFRELELDDTIERSQFKAAMSELVGECHPDFDEAYKELKIEGFSRQAEHIADYVSDVSGP